MVPAETAGDLLGGPLLGAQQSLHVLPQPGPGLGPGGFRPAGGLVGSGVGGTSAIALAPSIGGDLPADRGPVPAQVPADGGVGVAGLDAHSDLLALLEGQSAGPVFAVAQHDHTVFTDPPPQGGCTDPRLGDRLLDCHSV